MYVSGYNITIRTQVQNGMCTIEIQMLKHTLWEKTSRASTRQVWQCLWGGGIKGDMTTFCNVDLLNYKKDTLKT